MEDGQEKAQQAVDEGHGVVEPSLGHVSLFVVSLQFLSHQDVVANAHDVCVVKEVEEETEKTDQGQWHPVEAEEKPEHGHSGQSSVRLRRSRTTKFNGLFEWLIWGKLSKRKFCHLKK